MSATRPSRHLLPEGAILDATTWTVRVDGMVRYPRAFHLAEIEALGKAAHAGQFTCVAGWAEGALQWEGAPLRALLDLVEPLPVATALYTYAPGYRALVPADAWDTAILATRLNGAPLTTERGAPCRIIVPDRACQLSVKWVDHIELFTRKRDQPPGPRKPG